MHGVVAIHTGSSSKVPIITGGSAEGRPVIIDLMLVMAVLAEGRDPFHQQILMAAAVRGVADGAVFFHRRMFKEPGAALLGMALVAELVVVFRVDHVFRQGAMGVMAVGAHHLALDDGMMRHLVGVGADILVAVEARLWLVYGKARGMDGVAGNAGDIILFVCTHIPVG